MNIPDHLKDCAVVSAEKGYDLILKCRCGCGCEKFFASKECLSDDEAATVKKADKQWNRQVGWRTVYVESDEDGNVRHYVKRFFGLVKKEVRIPKFPFYASLRSVKLRCAECGTEHIVFDSRYHGYSAMTSELSPESRDYQFLYRENDGEYTVEIWLEYADDIENPNEFIGIDVYLRDEKNKRILFCTELTD